MTTPTKIDLGVCLTNGHDCFKVVGILDRPSVILENTKTGEKITIAQECFIMETMRVKDGADGPS